MQLFNLLKKVYYHGPRKSCAIGFRKVYQLKKDFYWRQKVHQNTAAYSWKTIARSYKLSENFGNVQDLFRIQFKKSSEELFFPTEDTLIISTAEKLLQNYGGFLGNKEITDQLPPWHIDTRLREQNPAADCYFDNTTFYRDIQIDSSKSFDLEKDIKLPWELSRCQHLVVLAQAYAVTKDKKFLHKIIMHMSDWLIKNPFMGGINWLCPMEAALRAINWLWVLHFVHDELSVELREKIICALYDHLLFLEENWEIYDGKTNNHYFSNLVGYLYLCFFFKKIRGIEKKITWCYQELQREAEKQIFIEGTSYESSTAYHRLMIELMQHATMLFDELAMPRSTIWHKRLLAMKEFIEWCSYHQDKIILIGDNDSGKVLFWPMKFKAQAAQGTQHFKEFGLSIYRSSRLHLSLRDHAYQQKQPSGHFHNDVGSLTLAVDGIPIFVDPGSYVYTASSPWRNYFRSVAVHNCLYIKDHEPIAFDDRLFALAIGENNLKQSDFTMQHDLYARFGLRNNRQINIAEHRIEIVDWWSTTGSARKIEMLQSAWNFTIAPEILVENIDNKIYFYHKKKVILILQSNLAFSIENGWFSSEYGIKIPCTQLRAFTPLQLDHRHAIKLLFN